MEVATVELPYPGSGASLFERIVDLPWPVLLDSSHPHYPEARYDILAARPYATLVTRGAVTWVRTESGERGSREDPFSLLRRELAARGPMSAPPPFAGGAIGYFGYDLARRIEDLPDLARDDLGLPEMAMGLYDWAVVADHHERRAWLAGRFDDEVRSRLSRQVPAARAGFRASPEVEVDLDRAAYARAFTRIQRYIRDGDCYQVNLARRFSCRVEGSSWALYRRLRELSPAPYAAYLGLPGAAVLSVSPERFLQVRGDAVETRPIKGTRPRGAGPEADAEAARELLASPKDRAENLMIVDLLRSDLGRTCALGSVRVPSLFEVVRFATVHHLVSTVTGRLAPGRHALDLLRGCFPGGSITGAPKLRAMQVIEGLEPHRRGVYCGAIGYVGHDGAMDTNIAIRTLVRTGGKAHFWAGGGIVADSRLEAEYREILDKARAMLRLIGQGEAADVGAGPP